MQSIKLPTNSDWLKVHAVLTPVNVGVLNTFGATAAAVKKWSK